VVEWWSFGSTNEPFQGIVSAMKGIRFCLLACVLGGVLLAVGGRAGVRAREAAERKATDFSQLPWGDEIEVQYDIRGCFFFAHYELKFERAADLKVSVSMPDFLTRTSGGTTNLVDIGSLTLSAADAEGLDRLWEYYRSASREWCSTDTEDLVVIYRHRGKVVRVEHFVNRFCTESDPRAIFLRELMKRLPRAKYV
jgi:hypothetical protein